MQSSMARNAATVDRTDSNASGDTSRLRRPAMVVVSGPVTAVGVPARAEACRHAAEVGSTETTARCGRVKRAPTGDAAQQSADAALHEHHVDCSSATSSIICV